MGQQISKATSAVKRAAATTRLSQQQQAQRTRSAAEAEWKKSSAATSTHNHSSQEYAPTRGQPSTTPVSSTANTNDDIDTSQMEMPPDLIKFLNDAGPLQRTLDKERTSSKVYDSLLSNENERQEQAKQANTRVRKKMPIISAVKNTNGDDDGTMVERSTNFSTTDRTSRLLDESTRFGVTREDIYSINEKLKGVTNVDSEEWKKLIQDEYKSITAKGDDESKSKSDDLKDLTPFENCMRHIGVPVIMKDNEGDIIGVWPSTVKKVQHSSGLKAVSEMNVGFIYKNEK